jgi:hypothetical protein
VITSVYLLFSTAGYFMSRSHVVRAMSLTRSQTMVSVVLPRKRGSPPAVFDCPGSVCVASALIESALSARRASAPPCAAIA